MQRESDLYAPVKALLTGQGYEVKGEVGAADLVAMRGAEPPVIVELKLKISLALFHQAVARLAVSDAVYIAVPKPSGPGMRTRFIRSAEIQDAQIGQALLQSDRAREDVEALLTERVV